MIQRYYKFPNKDSFEAAAAVLTSADNYAIDVIGHRLVAPAKISKAGKVTKAEEWSKEFYVNVLGDAPASFSEYEIPAPQTPDRKWMV